MKTMARDVTPFQQEQVERLIQIGAYLRHVREENQLSLEDVAARTMIQARSLKAIEEGKLHQLPEPVYIQGFIRRYAEVLGLDGSEFADSFPAERILRLPQPAWKDSPAAQLRPLHLYIAYIVLIIASVSLLSFIVERSAKSPNTTIQANSTVQTPAVAPRTATPTTTTEKLAATRKATPRPQSDKPVQVDVKLTAQSWLEVEADGEVKLAEVLQEGAERTWTANNEVRVRAGNAGGVSVAYNGGKAEPMGAPGAVEEKTFSPQSSTSTAQSNAEEPTSAE